MSTDHRDIGNSEQATPQSGKVRRNHTVSDHSDTNVERHTVNYIPLADRRSDGVWKLGPFWFVYVANITALAIGFTGARLGLGLGWAILFIVLGCAMGTIFTAAHSSQGPHMGLPQMIQSRAQFGFLGVIFPLLLGFFILVGLNIFNADLIASIISTATSTSYGLWLVIASALALLLAIAGYKWVHAIMRYLNIGLIPIFMAITVYLIFNLNPSSAAPDPGSFNLASAAGVFVVSFAFQIAYAPYVSDFSRYFPPNVRNRVTLLWTYLGIFLAGTWFIVLGALMATHFPTVQSPGPAIAGVGDQMLSGYGTFAVLFGAIALIAVYGANTYSIALAFLSITETIRQTRHGQQLWHRPSLTTRIAILVAFIIVAATGALLLTDDFIAAWDTFQTLLAYALVPWTMINLTDYFFIRHGTYSLKSIFDPRGVYGRVGWRGFTAYGMGLLFMAPFASVGPYDGPLYSYWLGGVDISIFVGLLVSGVSYYALGRSLSVETEINWEHDDIIT